MGAEVRMLPGEMDNIINALNAGDVITFNNDGIIKDIYEKHFGVKEEPREEIKESESLADDDLYLELNPIKSSLQVALSEFEKLNDKYLNMNSDLRFEYENMLSDLEDIVKSFNSYQDKVKSYLNKEE